MNSTEDVQEEPHSQNVAYKWQTKTVYCPQIKEKLTNDTKRNSKQTKTVYWPQIQEKQSN